MIYESREALESKLNERYDGPISQREGPGGRMFSYIPWTETVRRLNAVFGLDGWDTRDLKVIYNDGVYTVSLLLSVDAEYKEIDQDTGEMTRTGFFGKSVPGVGSAVARNQGDDNASKAALSDAISRAAKLLGDQFGFFLYEEKGNTQNAPRQQTQSRPTSASSSDRRPSEKQHAILKNQLHFEDAEIAEMPFSQWKAALDEHFAAKTGGF